MLLKINENPQTNYDVIVIGGGLAGMTVANVLASSKKRVLLLESHNKLGGLATWFRRPQVGHIFDVSLHGFPYGMQKSFRRYWGPKIANLIIPLNNIRFINPQYEVTTSYTREDFTRILTERFSIPLETVEKFFNLVMSMTPENDAGMNAGELLEQFFPNRPEVIRFLMEPITYANGHTLEDPALSFGIVFANFMRHGIYTAQGGTDHLIKLMKEELLQNGVDIKLNSRVEKIIVEDGKVQGISFQSKNPQMVKSKVVISNSNLKATIFKLIGSEHFSHKFLEKAQAVRLNTSSCQVYLGIKNGQNLPDIGDLIFYSDADCFNTSELLAMKVSSRTFSIYYPRLRPDNPRYTIVASTNARYDDWKNLSDQEYKAAKEYLIEDTIKCLQKLFTRILDSSELSKLPPVRDMLDWKEAATPLTFERYTGHWQGSSFGTKFEGLAIGKALPEEISGLFHCGSVGIIMSGWLGAVNYGAITANEALRFLGEKK